MQWFTVAAQIVNFLILVALLKHFLYKPILHAMDRREETIRSRLRTARENRDKAKDRIDEYEKKTVELEQRKKELLDEARSAADEERQKLERQARAEVDKRKQRWIDRVNQEREAFLRHVEERFSEELLHALKDALASLSDADINARIAQAFRSKLNALDDEDVAELREALTGNAKPELRSAFELPDTVRKELAEAVRRVLETEAAVDFETDPDIMAGIELRVGGRKVAWSLREHMARVRERMQAVLAENASKENTADDDSDGHRE